MTARRLRLGVPDRTRARVASALQALRDELGVSVAFPADVQAEAAAAAAGPSPATGPRVDRTDVPFWTVDPPGSQDLDQAMHLSRRRSGFRVEYAIADIPAFVPPGGAVDRAARARGQTLYFPDVRAPLHPSVLGEGAASLLPEQVRPALVWTVDLDEHGAQTSVSLVRALVRSRERLDYAAVQHRLDSGAAGEQLALLQTVGRLRQEQETARGGASLPVPEQEVVEAGGDGYELRYRPPVPAEDYNAQISLLTGMAAAGVMLEGGVGVLRTLPPPDERDVRRVRRVARGLGVSWPDSASYGEVLRGLDASDPRDAAVLVESTVLFRGSGYAVVTGTRAAQDRALQHAAVAAPYAHVTAPLRRLVDRFGLECCVRLLAGEQVPDWVRTALPELPEVMAASDRLAGAAERGSLDTVEAVLLEGRVGEVFDAVAVEHEKDGTVVHLVDPAVVARADGELPLGERVKVRLVEADVDARRVRFAAL